MLETRPTPRMRPRKDASELSSPVLDDGAEAACEGPEPPSKAPGRPPNPATPENRRMRSGDLLLGAERIRAEAAASKSDLLGDADRRHADQWEERARAAVPEVLAEIGVGQELLPEPKPGRGLELRNTVDSPDYVAADASRDRLELAHQAGALELALDTADTIKAENSLERMLAHQLASAHHSAMTLTKQLNARMEEMEYSDGERRERANVQATRLAGAAARMMASFQQGALTLQRLRTGGRQVVQVIHQQVQVNEGGQAVVAGKVGGGGGRKRKR